jgi:uncharacterized OB-fold protein
MAKEKLEPEVVIEGRVDVAYRWSAGVAGGRFLKELRDNGKIMGAKCPECSRVLVPPRSFCEECFVETSEWLEVGPGGTIQTYAESYFGLQGQRLEEPWYVGIIHLDDSDGGLFHRIVAGDGEIAIGARVEAVLAGDRSGTILDIEHFRTVGS